jgi:hypothetical protein
MPRPFGLPGQVWGPAGRVLGVCSVDICSVGVCSVGVCSVGVCSVGVSEDDAVEEDMFQVNWFRDCLGIGGWRFSREKDGKAHELL